MKKFICIVVVFVLLLSFSSCGCDHAWTAATCTEPKTCEKCGETEGATKSHSWIDATCVSPKTCEECGKTQGTASTTHSMVSDKCENCGLVQLTLDNYEDYFDVNITSKATNYYTLDGYLTVDCSANFSGNPNYEYNDVVIVIQFQYYDHQGYLDHSEYILGLTEEDPNPYSIDSCHLELNFAGNGTGTAQLNTSAAKESYRCKDASLVLMRTSYTVVSVSGTAKKIGN